MEHAPTWMGVYFDGQSAASQQVDVSLTEDGLRFTDKAGTAHVWAYRRLQIERLSDTCRLTCRGLRDATLMLTFDAVEALTQAVPYLDEAKRRRRQFVGMVAGLTAIAASFAGFVFGVMPASATWLARKTPEELELQIGENLASQVQLLFRPCESPDADALVASVVDRFAGDAGVSTPVHMSLVRTDMPNAFALPGGQMMATQGLLDILEDDQEAFWAVVAHELAHVKHRDGMVAVYRNLGVSTLLEIVTGGSGLAQQAILLGGQLNSLSYTRGQEQRADEEAYEILKAQALDPASLGRALDAISQSVEDEHHSDALIEAEWPEWMQTHPDTDKRVEAARENAQPTLGVLPLTEEEWAQVVAACDRRKSVSSKPSDKLSSSSDKTGQ